MPSFNNFTLWFISNWSSKSTASLQLLWPNLEITKFFNSLSIMTSWAHFTFVYFCSIQHHMIISVLIVSTWAILASFFFITPKVLNSVLSSTTTSTWDLFLLWEWSFNSSWYFFLAYFWLSPLKFFYTMTIFTIRYCKSIIFFATGRSWTAGLLTNWSRRWIRTLRTTLASISKTGIYIKILIKCTQLTSRLIPTGSSIGTILTVLIYLFNTSNLNILHFSIQIITDSMLVKLLVNPCQLMISFRNLEFNIIPLITVHNSNN